MSNKLEDIDIKRCTYYFFNDIVDIRNFDANNIEIDIESYKKKYLPHRICNNQRIEISKNFWWKSFICYIQKSEWIL